MAPLCLRRTLCRDGGMVWRSASARRWIDRVAGAALGIFGLTELRRAL